MARQYSGTLGNIGNCQIGVSVHAATDEASFPLDWRLYVPEAWDDTCAETKEAAASVQARRERAGIPNTVRHRTKWSQALEMIAEISTWGAETAGGRGRCRIRGNHRIPPRPYGPRHPSRSRG